MCIGQDFGHRQDYLDALAGGESEKAPTWRNLLGLLRRAGVDVESCFFTNALVGTRETESNTGPSPAFQNQRFIDECAAFLGRQIEHVDPVGIALLGIESFLVFSRLMTLTGTPLSPGNQSLRRWDTATTCLPLTVHVGGRTRKIARFLHPCFRTPNLRHRINPDLGLRTKVDVDEFEARLVAALN
jgi:hypothetical protein